MHGSSLHTAPGHLRFVNKTISQAKVYCVVCSDALEVWRGYFYNSIARNLLLSLLVKEFGKIGQHLTKLEAKIEWFFFPDTVYIANKLIMVLKLKPAVECHLV